MTAAAVTRLLGVYDADGTVRGELTYVLLSRLGRAHCALCDITHGALRERREWVRLRSQLPVPFETYHRDDQPETARQAARGNTPIVLAETDDGMTPLLDGAALEACGASPELLVEAVRRAVADAGLRWPT